jgi:hypothetical protein
MKECNKGRISERPFKDDLKHLPPASDTKSKNVAGYGMLRKYALKSKNQNYKKLN